MAILKDTQELHSTNELIKIFGCCDCLGHSGKNLSRIERNLSGVQIRGTLYWLSHWNSV